MPFAQIFRSRGASFVRRRVGFERFYVFVIQLLCAGAWVLSDFMHSESFFVRMRVGFERFYDSVIQLLCAGAWVLSDFMHSESILVHRHVGFKSVHALRIDSCAQACGFEEVQL